jgi:hypothetical protein
VIASGQVSCGLDAERFIREERSDFAGLFLLEIVETIQYALLKGDAVAGVGVIGCDVDRFHLFIACFVESIDESVVWRVSPSSEVMADWAWSEKVAQRSAAMARRRCGRMSFEMRRM